MRSPGANYSNIGEKIGNTTRRKETFAGFEPSTNRDEGDQVNTELLLSQSSNKNFLHIMLLSFEIGFLGVWFSRRSKSARSYLHSRCANRGSLDAWPMSTVSPIASRDTYRSSPQRSVVRTHPTPSL